MRRVVVPSRLARGLTMGRQSIGVRTPQQSRCEMSEIVGSFQATTPQRLLAGELLGLMDVCAARVAGWHLSGDIHTPIRGGHSLATVAVDQAVFRVPFVDGDTAVLVGTVCHVGETSIAVNVRVKRVQFPTRAEKLIVDSFFVMVAIDGSLGAAKGVVPALNIPDDDTDTLEMHQRYVESRAIGKEMAQRQRALETERIDVEALRPTPNGRKPVFRSFESTRTTANRLFFPSNLNFNNAIFGGEILRWMELHAVNCGRHFAGHRNVHTIGMHSVTFAHPICLTDWVSLVAHVVYVRNSTMEVEVEVSIEREHATRMSTKASFVLISLDRAGQRMVLGTGLDVGTASPEWVQRFVMAQTRYEGSVERMKKLKAMSYDDPNCS